jgi:hypothetical protein
MFVDLYRFRSFTESATGSAMGDCPAAFTGAIRGDDECDSVAATDFCRAMFAAPSVGR